LLDDFNGGTGSGAFAPGAGKVLAKPEVLAPNQQTTSEVTMSNYLETPQAIYGQSPQRRFGAKQTCMLKVDPRD
jgi:hypothetical protein